jgi:hypothetical protein
LTGNIEKKEEKNDFKDLYRFLPEDKKALLFPLLDSLSFIRSQLQELQKDIEQNGAVEEYQNGNNQKGYKQSASVQAYCSLLKNYSTIYSKISKMIPCTKETDKDKLKSLLDEFRDV